MKLKTIFIFLLILNLLCGNLFAQQNLDFLSYKLPKEDKKTLMKSIDVFTQNIRNRKWSNIYDLLSDKLKENWDSREDFIREQNEDIGYFVIEFSVKKDSILLWNDEKMRENVHLTGCLSLIEKGKKGKKVKYWGTIDVERNNSPKWVFLSFPIINPNFTSRGPKPC